MPLPCPHLDGYSTPAGDLNDELAALFTHLGQAHYPDQQWVFDELAGKMSDLPL